MKDDDGVSFELYEQVTTLLDYMRAYGISHTAWALWPQNSGGPDGLGSLRLPSVMTPAPDPGRAYHRDQLYA